MKAKRWLAVLVAAGPLGAQGPYGTSPKPQPADYPVHAKAGQVELAAEYHVRSFFAHGQTFLVQDYLVVEVALYPPSGKTLVVSSGQFTLRLNAKKQVLYAQAPGFVAASLKYADWERRRTVVATGGMGNVDVIVGRPEQVERFPGDRRPAQTRLPAPPRAPEPENPAGPGQPEPVKPDEAVVETALPAGEAGGPVSGYLYFAHKGKTKSIWKLELLYDGPAGGATLRLLP